MIMDWLRQSPWPWYVAGPLLGLSVPALLIFVGKALGVSKSLTSICRGILPRAKYPAFQEAFWKENLWNLFFVAGIFGGGWVSARWLSANGEWLPNFYYQPLGMCVLFLGGILVGFGTRYASGCTSGHTIMGISNLKVSSVVATLFFFIGGLTAAGLKLIWETIS